MRFSRVSLVCLVGLLSLAGCSPEVQSAPPLLTPEVWQVEVTPALRGFGPVFQRCAAEQSGVHLVVNERAAPFLDPQRADFAFRWGEASDLPAFAAVIAQEDLAVIVHPANPLTSLTASQAQALFAGQLDSWSQVIKARCTSCAPEFEGAVRAYGYAPGDDLQQAADWLQPGPARVLAPDPAAVRAAVAQERYSIGYLPASSVDANVKVVKIEEAEAGQIRHPILALASQEPQGARRTWLLCVAEARTYGNYFYFTQARNSVGN